MLEAAGERLRLGWIQGAFETTLTVNEQKTPAFCLVGALRSATRALRADGYTLQRAYRSVWDSLDREATVRLDRPAAPGMHNTHCLLSAWNEERGRTKDEVIALVERTLERLKVVASTKGRGRQRSHRRHDGAYEKTVAGLNARPHSLLRRFSR